MQKVEPLSQLDFVHLDDEAQQDFDLDFASLIPPRASLPAVQARSHEVWLITDHLFLHFDSISRIEEIQHLPTPVRHQVQHISWSKMLNCRTKGLKRTSATVVRATLMSAPRAKSSS